MSEHTNTNLSGDPLSDLVGEGKKYKTMEDLARSRLEADSFIEKLKNENAALREAISTETDPAEMLRLLEQRRLNAKKGSENAVNSQSNQSPVAPLSEERVLELLSERDRKLQQEKNRQLFDSTLANTFGSKTAEVVTKRLSDLGMDKQTFDNLALSNPQAALRVLGLKDNVGSGSLEPSVTTEAYLSEKLNGEVRNFAYFQKLRREMKEAYYSPEMQRQVWEARQKLGDAFWKS